MRRKHIDEAKNMYLRGIVFGYREVLCIDDE
jgi:hypothetical protein